MTQRSAWLVTLASCREFFPPKTMSAPTCQHYVAEMSATMSATFSVSAPQMPCRCRVDMMICRHVGAVSLTMGAIHHALSRRPCLSSAQSTNLGLLDTSFAMSCALGLLRTEREVYFFIGLKIRGTEINQSTGMAMTTTTTTTLATAMATATTINNNQLVKNYDDDVYYDNYNYDYD